MEWLESFANSTLKDRDNQTHPHLQVTQEEIESYIYAIILGFDVEEYLLDAQNCVYKTQTTLFDLINAFNDLRYD